MKKYYVISSSDKRKFEIKVIEYLNKGWELVGGATVIKFGIDAFYSQTMIKNIENKEKQMKVINRWIEKVKNDDGLKFCEGTAVPFWIVIDPTQMMKPDCHSVAYMVKGVFFSRESAEKWLKNNRHNLGKNPVVYCLSAVGTDLEEVLGED